MNELHKCPVCVGAGLVSPTLYGEHFTSTTAMPTPVKCRSCWGTGVIVLDGIKKYVVVDGELANLIDDIPPKLRAIMEKE